MNTGTWVDAGAEWVHLATGETGPGAEPPAGGLGTAPLGTAPLGG